MRLSPRIQQTIRRVVRESIGPDARVILFGSRVDDRARGGDIDLLIVTDRALEDAAGKELEVAARIQRQLGYLQPLDVLILDPGTRRLPIHEQALATGVTL